MADFRYKLVSESDAIEFTKKVNETLHDGWEFLTKEAQVSITSTGSGSTAQKYVVYTREFQKKIE